MMGLPAGTRIWIAAGFTDMRSGFNGLAAKVESVLADDPFSGNVFVFRGRRGNVVKLQADIRRNVSNKRFEKPAQ